MNLEDRKREEHRCRALRRVGSVLVCMALLLTTAFPPPPARAIAGVDDAVIAGLAAAFMVSCGIGFTVQNMDGNGVKEQIGRAIDQYVAETYEEITTYDWFTGNGHTAKEDFYDSGNLVIPAYQTNRLSEFVSWVRDKCNDFGALFEKEHEYVNLDDGSRYSISDENSSIPSSAFSSVESIRFEGGYYFASTNNGRYVGLFDSNGKLISKVQATENKSVGIARDESGALRFYTITPSDGLQFWGNPLGGFSSFTETERIGIESSSATNDPDSLPTSKQLLIDPSTIPGVTSKPASTGEVALDDALDAINNAIGAGMVEQPETGSASLDDALQAILDAIDAGMISMPAEGTFDDALAAILEAIESGKVAEAAPTAPLDGALEPIVGAIEAGMIKDPAKGEALDNTLDAVLDAIAQGQAPALPQSITDVGAVVQPGEIVQPIEQPVEEAFPDVAELGLPALGAALTSRFPFSIPWDVARAIKLLAAPAKAPYFEVDFMEPIAYRFGGFPGSTKIVLDFSEYEIIGQLTRWTSTIGFCLLLASGTKKLTWTA